MVALVSLRQQNEVPGTNIWPGLFGGSRLCIITVAKDSFFACVLEPR